MAVIYISKHTLTPTADRRRSWPTLNALLLGALHELFLPGMVSVRELILVFSGLPESSLYAQPKIFPSGKSTFEFHHRVTASCEFHGCGCCEVTYLRVTVEHI